MYLLIRHRFVKLVGMLPIRLEVIRYNIRTYLYGYNTLCARAILVSGNLFLTKKN